MGSTLMATTSILISAGLGAVISSTYSVKKPLNDTIYGAHGELMVALKYVSLLTIFLFSFFCHSLSIRFLSQVSVLICIPGQDPMGPVTAEYLTGLFEKGCFLNTAGNRLFYAAIPLLLWIFGPVLVFLCFAAMVPVLYNLDFICKCGKGGMHEKPNGEYVWGLKVMKDQLVLEACKQLRDWCWPCAFVIWQYKLRSWCSAVIANNYMLRWQIFKIKEYCV